MAFQRLPFGLGGRKIRVLVLRELTGDPVDFAALDPRSATM
jgi:hypothetical protein